MRKLAFAFTLVLFASGALAQSQFVEGQHYDIVAKEKSDKPVVTEFFSLFCGHCFQFDPFIDSLHNSLPKDVEFERSHVNYIPRDNKPVSFGIVKAYNVMLDLDMEEKLRRAFFVAIHLGQDPIDSEEKIRQVFLDQGVPAAKFDQLYNSKSVIDRATAMSELWIEREIDNVPTIVVNHKYKINMGTMRSMEELKQLTNYLLKQK